ncbi:MAG: hypothetical protein KGI26_06050 [Thaumarchaeota archaeon]|nr:hypothetical protein [Nitrososphaerota archaeon]
MPRLLGLELSGGRLALRAVLAAVFGGLAFIVFYLVPAALGGLISQSAGSAGGTYAASVAGALVSPALPIVGLGVAALVFLGVLLRGTKVYGPILVVLGVVLLVYVYTAFQGGTVNLAIPKGAQYSATGSVAIDLAPLMYLLMLAPALTLLKGVVITAVKPDGSQTE